MKKNKRLTILLSMTIIFLLVGVVACKSEKDIKNEENQKIVKDTNTELSKIEKEILEYVYPKKDTAYLYEGEGYLTDWTIFNDYIGDNYFQRKTQVEDTMVGELLVIEDDHLAVVNGIGNYSFTYDLSDDDYLFETIILQGPLKKGTEWVKEDSDRLKSISTITGLDISIETPLDTYKTLEVTTIIEPKDEGDIVTVKEYYAKDIGMVAYIEEGSELGKRELYLTEIKRDVGMEENFIVFTPNEKELEYEEVSTMVYTNTNMEELLTELLKSNKEAPLLEEEDEILKIIYPDSSSLEEEPLQISLSKSYQEYLEENSAMEEERIEALVNTLCINYNVLEVEILIEDKPYKTKNIETNVFNISEGLLG